MAIVPGAIYRPIPSTTDPAITPIGAIFHVDAGNAWSLYEWFGGADGDGGSGGIESHGHIRWDGSQEQYRDTLIEADANYKANSFVRDGTRYGFLSFETQGYASGVWTPQQVDTIKADIVWVAETYDVPLRVAPAWDQPGFGYHTLYPDMWTNVAGKTCPGPNRIVQWNEIIVPWLEAGADMAEPRIPQPSWYDPAITTRLMAAGRITTVPVTETYDYWRVLIIADRELQAFNSLVVQVAQGGGLSASDREKFNAHRHNPGGVRTGDRL